MINVPRSSKLGHRQQRNVKRDATQPHPNPANLSCGELLFPPYPEGGEEGASEERQRRLPPSPLPSISRGQFRQGEANEMQREREASPRPRLVSKLGASGDRFREFVFI